MYDKSKNIHDYRTFLKIKGCLLQKTIESITKENTLTTIYRAKTDVQNALLFKAMRAIGSPYVYKANKFKTQGAKWLNCITVKQRIELTKNIYLANNNKKTHIDNNGEFKCNINSVIRVLKNLESFTPDTRYIELIYDYRSGKGGVVNNEKVVDDPVETLDKCEQKESSMNKHYYMYIVKVSGSSIKFCCELSTTNELWIVTLDENGDLNYKLVGHVDNSAVSCVKLTLLDKDKFVILHDIKILESTETKVVKETLEELPITNVDKLIQCIDSYSAKDETSTKNKEKEMDDKNKGYEEGIGKVGSKYWKPTSKNLYLTVHVIELPASLSHNTVCVGVDLTSTELKLLSISHGCMSDAYLGKCFMARNNGIMLQLPTGNVVRLESLEVNDMCNDNLAKVITENNPLMSAGEILDAYMDVRHVTTERSDFYYCIGGHRRKLFQPARFEDMSNEDINNLNATDEPIIGNVKDIMYTIPDGKGYSSRRYESNKHMVLPMNKENKSYKREIYRCDYGNIHVYLFVKDEKLCVIDYNADLDTIFENQVDTFLGIKVVTNLKQEVARVDYSELDSDFTRNEINVVAANINDDASLRDKLMRNSILNTNHIARSLTNNSVVDMKTRKFLEMALYIINV